MPFANLPLPPAIAMFLHAIEVGDGTSALAAFSETGILIDQGHEYRGPAIMRWVDLAVRGARMALHPIHFALRGNPTTLRVLVRDREADTAPAEFDWEFSLDGSKIHSLTIVRSPPLEMPAPVAAFVLATNSADIEALLATFADDALVNDQFLEHCGAAAIRKWAARDIIGQRVTIYVLEAVQRHNNAIVTAKVDGDYDKRGLPDPLVLAFYFSTSGEKIVQLIILRNEVQP